MMGLREVSVWASCGVGWSTAFDCGKLIDGWMGDGAGKPKKLNSLSVDKGLLREVREVQKVMASLVLCRVSSPPPPKSHQGTAWILQADASQLDGSSLMMIWKTLV